MSDFQSKYTGAQVEALLDAVEQGGTGGGGEGTTIIVDSELSTTSTNPVQNKAITIPLNTLTERVDDLASEKQDTINDLATIRSGAALGATALQSETYKGTVTGVKINGTTKNPSSGVVDLGTVITSHQDISGKQDKLVSGTNIKTINNTSILGSGNISITGGSGTITGVSANGTSIATSGVANIPAATTSKYGVTQLSSSTSSTSTSLAATPSAVKAAYDLANGKQDKLVSGTNIKTINGTSILGSGNITISGGSSSGGSGAYAQVNHGTSDTTFTLTPNTFHVWDEVASLALTLGSETAGVANEFVFQFTSGATATSLTLPDGIKWVNNTEPLISESKIYQISILNGLAVALEFKNTVVLIENKLTVTKSGIKTHYFTFDFPVASDLTIVYDTDFESGSVQIASGSQQVTKNISAANVAIVKSITPAEDGVYKYTF